MKQKHPGWTHHETPPGLEKFGAWEHTASGWQVVHCGHPTANWPYYLLQPGRTETVVSFNGLGFVSAEVGRYAVALILSGQAQVTTKDCFAGVLRIPTLTAHGGTP